MSVLLQARAQLELLRITASNVRAELRLSAGNNHSQLSLEKHVRRSFQGQVLQRLIQVEVYFHEHVLRTKLKRWKLHMVPEGTLARRSARLLRAASDLVAPRVVLVLFRTWFNGWCTARRFQVRQACCLFGCRASLPDECLDSIEHYALCPVVAEFASQRLQLPASLIKNRLAFLCLNTHVDDETYVLQLLLLYAVYTASNCIRFAKPPLKVASMQELLLQYVHQGAGQLSFPQRVVHKLVTQRRATRRRIH